MKDISEEQLIIFNYIKEGFNVCIDAIPGSGKSTSMLTLSQIIPSKKLLHITYNSMLRKEFKEKTVNMKIQNIDVHTYHSFAVKFFSQDAYTDTGLRKILFNKNTPRYRENEIPHYDILILDECQDMSPLYFQFVLYFLSFFKSKIQLVILGDFMQGIYDFKGADIRFLTMAQDIWKNKPFLSSSEFKHCSLTMSYRITNQMAKYI
ncbi:UvrD-helicase domain-containing protein, partial [Flavobacterium sp.]|uniref:UvrD-helicase domain-containing protein n=1 Tax=Flavobacterium sp. TaxID=239 RepID=UPI00374D1A74